MTDQELVEGLSGRERSAINYLVNTYQKKVIKTAYYFIGNMEDAEDLSQEIFLEIIKSVDSFRRRSAFSTWVYRIVVNRSLNTLRKNKRRGVFSSIERVFLKGNGSGLPELNLPVDDGGSLDLKETNEILNRAISELPENQRIAFLLNKYEELSYKEIAEIMKLSLSSVESLIHRAKINLQKKLVRHFSHFTIK